MTVTRQPDPKYEAQLRDNFICQYCGRDLLEDSDAWHNGAVDHLLAVKYGGDDTLTNLVTSCHLCNALKGSKRCETLEEARVYVRKKREEWERKFAEARRAVRGS